MPNFNIKASCVLHTTVELGTTVCHASQNQMQLIASNLE